MSAILGAAGAATGAAILSGLALRFAPVQGVRELFRNDPDHKLKLALFTGYLQSRAKLIMREGQVVHILNGNRPALYVNDNDPAWWNRYKQWVWETYQLHPVNPFGERIYSYDLNHRYRSEEKDGKEIFVPVEPRSEGFRSDHVRIDPFPWNVMFRGVEIESLAFTVKATAQVRILEDKIEDALFRTLAWDIALDRALNSVTRGIVRSHGSIDMVIGSVKNYKDIFRATIPTGKDYGVIQAAIMKAIREYKIVLNDRDADGNPVEREMTLLDFGIDVLSFDIVDFEPELGPTQLERLQSAAIVLREARGNILKAKSDAERLRLASEVLSNYPDLAKVQLDANALIEASKAGNLNALLAGLIQKIQKGN